MPDAEDRADICPLPRAQAALSLVSRGSSMAGGSRILLTLPSTGGLTLIWVPRYQSGFEGLEEGR